MWHGTNVPVDAALVIHHNLCTSMTKAAWRYTHYALILHGYENAVVVVEDDIMREQIEDFENITAKDSQSLRAKLGVWILA